LDLSGLENRIYKATSNIDFGRKGFATRGKEQKGRIAYEKGIADALSAFKEAQLSSDPKLIFLAEYYFLSQELAFCHKSDKAAFNSLTKAIQSLDDAFRALKVVENSVDYRVAEETYPRSKDYRVKGFPKDAFHIACSSHRTRLKNNLSSIGVDPIEKFLLEQRRLNLTTAQNSYVKRQKIALE
jgi:hypothetical protein